MAHRDDIVGLCDLLDRILDLGVVLKGHVVISVADVEMIYLEVAVLVAAADRILPGVAPPKRRVPK